MSATYTVTSKTTGKGKQAIATFHVMPESGAYQMGPFATRDEATKFCATLNGATTVEAEEEEEEPTAEQSAALQAYIAAREEVEGLRDDIRNGSDSEIDAALNAIYPARTVYAEAHSEAKRLGVLEVAQRMFR